jgi:hypothetical protein
MQPLPDLPENDPFWQKLQAIWAARTEAGLFPRSTEEVESQRLALREEMDQELDQAIRLQEESGRRRDDR